MWYSIISHIGVYNKAKICWSKGLGLIRFTGRFEQYHEEEESGIISDSYHPYDRVRHGICAHIMQSKRKSRRLWLRSSSCIHEPRFASCSLLNQRHCRIVFPVATHAPRTWDCQYNIGYCVTNYLTLTIVVWILRRLRCSNIRSENMNKLHEKLSVFSAVGNIPVYSVCRPNRLLNLDGEDCTYLIGLILMIPTEWYNKIFRLFWTDVCVCVWILGYELLHLTHFNKNSRQRDKCEKIASYETNIHNSTRGRLCI